MRSGSPSRRAVIGSLAALPVALAAPANIRPAKALPTAGVELVQSGSAEGETLALQYNLAHTAQPRVRAMCQSTENAAEAIRWARDNDLQFAIRSGGHCFAGTSNHPDLVIDVRGMNSLAINAETSCVTAQPGAKLFDLYREAYPYNLAPAAGWCGDVGLGGHILGGGVGYLARANGLLCDHLKQATIVDANGVIHHCSAEENQDLFWACRGGGGGLGLVSEFEIEFQRVGETNSLRVFGGLAPQLATDLVIRWMQWSNEAPRETTSQMALSMMSDGRFFAKITGLSTEPRERLVAALTDVCKDVLPVSDDSVISGSFEEIMEETVLSIPHFYIHSASHTALYEDVVSADLIAVTLSKALETRTDLGGVTFLFETLGGAIGDLPSDATAFPHRKSAFLVNASFGTISSELLEEGKPSLKEVGELMWRQAIGKGYVNYRDRSLGDYEAAYWGPNTQRLRAIKRRLDPDGIFDGIQTIRR